MGVEIPPREREIFGVVQLIEKHRESLLQCLLQKDHLTVNNGMQQKG